MSHSVTHNHVTFIYNPDLSGVVEIKVGVGPCMDAIVAGESLLAFLETALREMPDGDRFKVLSRLGALYCPECGREKPCQCRNDE